MLSQTGLLCTAVFQPTVPQTHPSFSFWPGKRSSDRGWMWGAMLWDEAIPDDQWGSPWCGAPMGLRRGFTAGQLQPLPSEEGRGYAKERTAGVAAQITGFLHFFFQSNSSTFKVHFQAFPAPCSCGKLHTYIQHRCIHVYTVNRLFHFFIPLNQMLLSYKTQVLNLFH